MKNDSNSFKTSSNLTRSPPNASLPVGGAGTSPRSLGAPGSRAPEHKRSLPGRQTLHPQARATTYRETHKEKQTCFITLYVISLKSHGALICGIQIEDHLYAFLSSVIALISIFSPLNFIIIHYSTGRYESDQSATTENDATGDMLEVVEVNSLIRPHRTDELDQSKVRWNRNRANSRFNKRSYQMLFLQIKHVSDELLTTGL